MPPARAPSNGVMTNGKYIEEVVRKGEDGFHVSTKRFVHERSGNDCADTGFEKGIAERTWLGDEDADVLYQPGGKEPEYFA